MQHYISTKRPHRQTAARARWHAHFGCPTRIGLEETAARARSLEGFVAIYVDLDGLNALNHAYGHTGVDSMIAAFWRRMQVRRRDLSGQWEGGDEFCIVVPALDAVGVARRVQAALAASGLSGSLGIATIGAGPALPALEDAMQRGEVLVKAARGGARGEGQRGVLVVEAGL